MKRIALFFTFMFLICLQSEAFAQKYGDYYDGKNNYYYDSGKKTKKTSTAGKKKQDENSFTMQPHNFPGYIAVSPMVYMPMSASHGKVQDYIGIGGGFDIKYKYNFNRWSALAADFLYTYASGVSGVETVSFHEFDIRIMLLLQYEPKKGEAGFNPWIGAGAALSISLNSLKKSGTVFGSDYDGIPYPAYIYNEKHKKTGANIGFAAGAGLRYVFENNFSLGAAVDYMIVNPYYDTSGLRVYFEAGYRF